MWAYLAFVPFALLGLLLPYPRTGAWDVQAYARGSALACAAFAGLLTALGAGSAFCFLLSFTVGAPAAFLLSKVPACLDAWAPLHLWLAGAAVASLYGLALGSEASLLAERVPVQALTAKGEQQSHVC